MENLETYKPVNVRENERVTGHVERSKLEKSAILRKLQTFRKLKTLYDTLEARESETRET